MQRDLPGAKQRKTGPNTLERDVTQPLSPCALFPVAEKGQKKAEEVKRVKESSVTWS